MVKQINTADNNGDKNEDVSIGHEIVDDSLFVKEVNLHLSQYPDYKNDNTGYFYPSVIFLKKT